MTGEPIRDLRDALPRPGGSPPLGAALGVDGLTVVSGRAGPGGFRPREHRRRTLASGPAPEGWPELERALTELREELELEADHRPELHLALLPPLARARVVELPAADREALRKLAGREAGRHFLSVPDDPVADAWPLERARGGPVSCVLACADGPAVAAAVAAVRAAGFRPGLAAPAAWTAAEGAAALEAELRSGSVRLRLRAGDRTLELSLEEGRLSAVRALGPGAGDDEAVDGSAVRTVDADHPLGGLDASGLAAFGALVAPEEGPALLPPGARERWRRRRRARAGLLAAVAALLLAAAGWLHLRGLDRELAAVEARRAAVAPSVAEAEAARGAALRMGELLDGLAGLPRPGPAWSRVVAEVGRRMPRSAYLRVLDAAGDDGLRLSGTARSPSTLVPRLAASPLFTDVTLASVSRSPRGAAGGDAFEITLRLMASDASAAGDGGRGASASGSRPAGDGAPADGGAGEGP